MNIWQHVAGIEQIGLISGTCQRLVESQQHVATLSYVDTLEEQVMLEALLEQAKPSYSHDIGDYHYLLKTPFRYPPLQWGSRFGRVFEPSLFYAGLTLNAVLVESAFYRFVFWHSMLEPPPEPFIRTQHTLFSVQYQSEKGVKLHKPPFSEYQTVLTDPVDYSATQSLGSQMRDSGVEVFEYVSARDKLKDHCIALFSPKAFKKRAPTETSQWLCELSANKVVFKQAGSHELKSYLLDSFKIDGALPFPP